MEKITLYRKNSFGIGVWHIQGVVETTSRGSVFISHAVTENGSMVNHIDPVTCNQSGRSIEAQLQLQINARISRQLDKGYKRTREEAMLGTTNQLGLANPMLAQKLSDVKITQSMLAAAYVQPKLDGHRCLITRQNGDMFAYSRKGKPINTVPHILDDAYNWMQDGDILDGELYVHGRSLQSLSSDIKRAQATSGQLCYFWYDMIDRTKPFALRHQIMNDLYANSKSTQLILTPTKRVGKMSEVYDYFRECRVNGFEGSMLRISSAGYEDGKRTNQLIKVKERHDDEAKVIGCRASSQGWAILRVEFDNGGKSLPVEFDISAPGSVPEKTEVLHNFETKYKGREVTIEYAMLTADGIPFHAVATRWREDI